MKLAARILRRTAPLEQGGAGPMPKTVLRGIAKHHGYTPRDCDQVLRELLDDGRLVKISDRRHALYGHPCSKRRRRRRA